MRERVVPPQVADCFHLLQNFRETVERQLGRFEAPISDSQVNARDNQATPPLPARSDCASDAVTQKRLMCRGRQAVRQELFDEIRALFEGGSSVRDIARKLGLGRRRVERWVRRIDLPDFNTMASKPCTPAYFGALVARRWAEGITKVRHLFAEIRHRGYTGSYSHLARFLAPWRCCEPSFDGDEQVRAEQEEPAPVRVRTLDPMTGRAISPLAAAALCVKPRGQMTARQVANVDALKAASAEFTAMRHARLGSTRCSVLRGRYARTWRLFGTLCWNLGATGLQPLDERGFVGLTDSRPIPNGPSKRACCASSFAPTAKGNAGVLRGSANWK